MKNLLTVLIFLLFISGCKKEKNDIIVDTKKPFVLKAGEVDPDSTIYKDYIPDKEFLFQFDFEDTLDHFDTINVSIDSTKLYDFSILIEHRTIGLSLNVYGNLINNNNISFANYNYSHGMKKGDTINESLTWNNSKRLILFEWHSDSQSSWTSSYYFAFRFTKDYKIKYGWLNSVWETYEDISKNPRATCRYSLIDLAYKN